MANKAAVPAVSMKETYNQLTGLPLIVNLALLMQSGSSMSFFNAMMPKSGIVNSAITRIEATVRNFAYIGI